jgi:uncharacterized protein YeaO (DUF488 family)
VENLSIRRVLPEDEEVDVRVQRVYEPASDDDGYRVLVDRLWPRGLSKAAAQLDEWCRTVAPSTELRRWYGHDPQRFAEFRRRYRVELASDDAATALQRLRDLAEQRPLTLLTATREVAASNAAVVAELLAE